jgi:hypothetical protein
MGSREIKKPTNTLKRHCKGKPKKNYKTVAEDWKNWIKAKHEGKRQAE